MKGRGIWIFPSSDTNSPYDDLKPIINGTPETGEYMCTVVIEDSVFKS